MDCIPQHHGRRREEGNREAAGGTPLLTCRFRIRRSRRGSGFYCRAHWSRHLATGPCG